MSPVQTFTDAYLRQCRAMTPEQIVAYLEEYRRVRAEAPSRSRLISMKVPEPLLNAFRTRARLQGLRYQTQIKRLMRDWLERG